ncbi:MAG: TetR family transcriptional regulator [Proteobacteria bacterium]|nr:TetR family transcriptional regulator [Pseudomonadota bacterium]
MPDGSARTRTARAKKVPAGEAPAAEPPAKDTARVRSPDAERTRLDIIAVARSEFVEKGLDGASVNDIAARTRTTKPMIYYYFGSKEKLYAAVMEEAYGGMRAVEQSLRLEHLEPMEAVRRLVEVTFDYHADNPDFVRLIAIENIHLARHIAAAPAIAKRNAAVIEIIRALLKRGEQEGVFRKGVDPVDLHLLISSFCFYRVSNRHTWSAIFGRDVETAKHAAAQRRMIVEAVERYLAA